MKTRRRPATLLGLTAALLPLAARAEERDDEIVVTGESIEATLPQELARYGSDIATVTDAQIRDRGEVDLAGALRGVPGLYIASGSGPFSYVDLSLQGSRTQDVLWTIDGVRINNRLYGGTSPNDTLPASMIERVEVLKGGESLFYGTQAAAGVINVVTRSFREELGGQLSGTVDSFGGTSLDGYARGSIGAHRFVAYASYNRTAGYRPYSVMQPSATDRLRGYDLWSAGGKYRVDLAPDLRLDLHYQHTEAKLDSLSAARIHTGRNDRNEEIASARLDYTGSDTLQFFLKGYFHDWKTAYVQILNPLPAGPPVTIYPAGTFWGYRDYGGSAVVKLHPHRGLEYWFGYDFQSFSGRDDVLLIGNTSERVHAGIFQLRTTDEISRRARLAAGIRYNATGGTKKTIWNISGRYELGEHFYLEGVGGTSFLLPDAGSLYGIDPCCEIGNPKLRPEQSTNLNLTAGGTFALGSDALHWKASYFHRDISDLIDTTYDDPAFPNGVYVNVDDKVRVRGVELGVDARFGQAWNLAASYTWSRVRNQGATTQRDRSPSRFAKASLSYAPQHRPFGANAALQWVGDVYSSPSGFPRHNYGNYALIDLGAHLWLDGDARRNRFGVNIENLTGRDYATRGFSSAAADAGGRFLYFIRGVPRTLRISYGLGF